MPACSKKEGKIVFIVKFDAHFTDTRSNVNPDVVKFDRRVAVKQPAAARDYGFYR